MHRQRCASLAAVTAATLVILVAPPLALGGVASVEGVISHELDDNYLVYEGSAAEDNKIIVTRSLTAATGAATYTVTDAVGVTAGEGCAQADPHAAICVVFSDFGPVFDLGDGNDAIAFAGTAPPDDGASITAGPGDDTVSGTASADTLDGVTGDDVLRGLADGDEIDGGRGNDRLSGGPGKDNLVDSRGRDRFTGGAGNDRINSRDHSRHDRAQRDTINCGAGHHDVAFVDAQDRVGHSCENVRIRPS